MPTLLHPDGYFVIDDSGNFAMGTFDIEAWHADWSAIQLSAKCALAWSKAGDEVMLVDNAYASDAATWKYRTTGYARRLLIKDEGMFLEHAESGTIDDDITWIIDLGTMLNGNVHIGPYTADGRLAIQPNNTVDNAQVGGLTKVDVTAVGNVGTGEDTLASKNVIANTLGVSAQSVTFEAFGTTANNANVKTLRVRFGTAGVNLVASRTLTASVAGSWHVRGTIYRTSAATQKSVTVFHDGTTSEVDIVTTLDQTLTGDVLLKITGEATSNNDIVLEGFKITWDDQTS